MDDEEIGSSAEHMLGDDLAEELRRLHPLLARQRTAATVRPEAGFKRALRAQLTATPRTAPAQGAAIWHTLIATFLPAVPQPSLRGHGPQVMTYTADDVTISLTTRPADSSNRDLSSIYGEVDLPNSEQQNAEAATVEVLHGEAVISATTLDELGNFVLPDLPPRVYALRLRFPNRREVIIPPTSYAAEGDAHSG